MALDRVLAHGSSSFCLRRPRTTTGARRLGAASACVSFSRRRHSSPCSGRVRRENMASTPARTRGCARASRDDPEAVAATRHEFLLLEIAEEAAERARLELDLLRDLELTQVPTGYCELHELHDGHRRPDGLKL